LHDIELTLVNPSKQEALVRGDKEEKKKYGKKVRYILFGGWQVVILRGSQASPACPCKGHVKFKTLG
jgi:hypothetical protein